MRIQGLRFNEIEQSYWPFNEGPSPKSYKLRQNLCGTTLEGKSIGLNPQKIRVKKEGS
jgi:hypothetical protein